MKHILNNLSEEEKNAIREQHTGGMKVITENFSKLINSKLGDSKPLVNEQPQPTTSGKKDKHGNSYTVQKVPSGKFKIFITNSKFKTPTDAFVVNGGGTMWKEYDKDGDAYQAINDIVNADYEDDEMMK
jgi:hypothetical protein